MEARLLDVSRSFAEARGDAVLHLYQQREHDDMDSPEHFFDQHGREVDPKTGELFDPNQIGLEAYEIQRKPAPAAKVQDVEQLTRIVANQQKLIERLVAAVEGPSPAQPAGNGVEPPKALGDMTAPELRNVAEEMGVDVPRTANRATILRSIQEAEAA